MGRGRRHAGRLLPANSKHLLPCPSGKSLPLYFSAARLQLPPTCLSLRQRGFRFLQLHEQVENIRLQGGTRWWQWQRSGAWKQRAGSPWQALLLSPERRGTCATPHSTTRNSASVTPARPPAHLLLLGRALASSTLGCLWRRCGRKLRLQLGLQLPNLLESLLR